MERATQKAREEFVAILTRELVGTHSIPVILHAANLLMRHGTTYARIQEDWCNREMSERETARVEKREQQLEARIATICVNVGTGVVFGGDPAAQR